MSGADGFEVPTTPVAPGRDRGPWLVITTLAFVLLGAIALAHLSSGPTVVQVTPTVGPTMPLVAIEPVATALPQLEWFSGTETAIAGTCWWRADRCAGCAGSAGDSTRARSRSPAETC